MINRFILSITLVFAVSLGFGQDQYKQYLAGLATIEFPGKPNALDTLGQKVYSYSEENANYFVIVQDLSKQKDFTLREGKLDKFYNEIVEGFMKGSKGKLMKRNPFGLNELIGYMLGQGIGALTVTGVVVVLVYFVTKGVKKAMKQSG